MALPVLLIADEFADVNLSGGMDVEIADAVIKIILELTSISVTIPMQKAALAVQHIVCELAVVYFAVILEQLTKTLFDVFMVDEAPVSGAVLVFFSFVLFL